MPGNKNSGRRKTVAHEVSSSHEEGTEPVKRAVGRPKRAEPLSETTLEPPSQTNESLLVRNTTEPQTENPRPTPALRQTKKNVSDLRRRSSSLNSYYNDFLGPSLHVFPSSRLPLKRIILQRYRALRSFRHNSPKSEVIRIITDEVLKLWEDSHIPHDTYRAACKSVQNLCSKWIDACQDDRKSPRFQKDLNKLFDIRHPSVKTLSTLKSYLQSSGNEDWLRDYEFFKGQCSFPQTGTMSSTVDGHLEMKHKKRSKRQAKYEAYAATKSGDFSRPETSTTATTPKPRDTSYGIDQNNVVHPGPRRSAILAMNRTAEVYEVAEDDTDLLGTAEEHEWEPPVRFKRKLRERPDKVTITLPAKKLPTVLAKTSLVTKTSSRHELKIWTTLIKRGGGDMNNVSLSVSTIGRQRRSEVLKSANDIRENVKKYAGSETEHDFVVIHFDGKVIHYITGDTDDRLAICMSVPNFIPGQFLASPGMPNGKGATMCDRISKVVVEFGLSSKVEALVFDTTASNTGVHRGATTLFEKSLQRAILWLACRHHIAELFVKHANDTVRGESKAPEDPLFSRFRKVFSFIDVEAKEVWEWPDTNDWRHERATDVLTWAENHMELGTWPREDYRELLELTVIFLGGVVKRTQHGSFNIISTPIRKPGACHRARFMAHCLYILKIFLFRAQFDELTPEQASQISILAEYIALIHVPYFLKTPLSVSAPRQDRELWVDLISYKGCFAANTAQHDMITAVQDNFCAHLWYLSEELVIFGLFDENLSILERHSMAAKLLSQVRPNSFAPGKPKFPTDLMTRNPHLESFIGPRSWILFHKLSAVGTWLQKEPEEWENDQEYIRMELFLRDLKVVNDLAERCVKDITEYRNMARDPEHRDDILMVTSDHRKVFRDIRKQGLNVNYNAY